METKEEEKEVEETQEAEKVEPFDYINSFENNSFDYCNKKFINRFNGNIINLLERISKHTA